MKNLVSYLPLIVFVILFMASFYIIEREKYLYKGSFLFLNFFIVTYSIFVLYLLYEFQIESKIGEVIPELIIQEIIRVKYYYYYNNILYGIFYASLGIYLLKSNRI